jgi:hypothetical protein
MKAIHQLILLTISLGFGTGVGCTIEASAQPQAGTSPTIETNAATFYNAPSWLRRNRAEKIISRLETRLEWNIRRVAVHFYSSPGAFEKAHSLGPYVTAVSVMDSKAQVVHLGPRVDNVQFDSVFAHELVHIILYQKYKGAVPRWLEEGLANHLAEKAPIDYQWLSRQTLPVDLRESLQHPLGPNWEQAQFKYKASQAFAEMLSKKCDLTNLLRLSVERKMEDYIKTYCEIADINVAFRKWVTEKATRAKR